MSDSNEKMGIGKKFGLGAAIASALAFATVGYVYLTGEGSDERKKKLRGWMFRMKGEIMERLEKLEEVTEDQYKKIVDEVSETYANMRDVSSEEVALISKQLKESWSHVSEKARKEMADKGGKISAKGDEVAESIREGISERIEDK